MRGAGRATSGRPRRAALGTSLSCRGPIARLSRPPNQSLHRRNATARGCPAYHGLPATPGYPAIDGDTYVARSAEVCGEPLPGAAGLRGASGFSQPRSSARLGPLDGDAQAGGGGCVLTSGRPRKHGVVLGVCPASASGWRASGCGGREVCGCDRRGGGFRLGGGRSSTDLGGVGRRCPELGVAGTLWACAYIDQTRLGGHEGRSKYILRPHRHHMHHNYYRVLFRPDAAGARSRMCKY